MLNLSRLAMFVAVVDAKSFTGAAAALGQTKAVVSFNIRQLESELGVTLLLRSTRRLTLTDAGERLYQRSLLLLRNAGELLEDVQASHEGFSGELRVTTTPEYASHVVGPALAAFSRAHPALRIRHFSSSQHADLISERVDVAIRLGTLQDSAYRAALISRFDIFPVASPAWLERRHPISTPEALGEADWLVHTRLASPLRWALTGPNNETLWFEITRPPAIAADGAGALMSFALEGCGVALLPAWLVNTALEEGKLVRLLPAYRFPAQGVYAVYPDARHVSGKVRGFIDFLRDREAQAAAGK
ncbi:LysR substrate-binding domain-containing protein [Cronobacter turicensis]|uniref:LysR family transcriptional regulator n=1 Tax=Cronobacter turicensis TaxID=413502 RepID=UPI001587FEBA|nr:LysR family transcriptional regulator [Cronobacter turicensis]EKM5762054.1 LysR family transcriptional regulator [Cronobacter turicensis]MDK1237195.1 LysR substrate-binding domain-containing protein [Cronobacter turicensis]NUW57410.1 LysR family transcriptional regulator [Cronobacter turicensis]